MLPTNVKSKAEESSPKETKRTFFSSFSPNPVTKETVKCKFIQQPSEQIQGLDGWDEKERLELGNKEEKRELELQVEIMPTTHEVQVIISTSIVNFD
jgi:hypothetical protein